jgi:hypothetical protein
MSSRLFEKKIIFFMMLVTLIYFVLGEPCRTNCFGGEYAVDKGSNMFGITAGFINASGDLYGGGKPFTAILLMPHTVHFFVRNLGIGGDLLMLLTAQGDNKSTTVGAGPKIMYFFGGKDSKSYPYLTSGFYYLMNDIEYEDIDFLLSGTYSGTRFKAGAGISWLIYPHMSLLVEASYNRDKLKPDDNGKSKSGNMVIVSMGLAGFTF